MLQVTQFPVLILGFLVILIAYGLIALFIFRAGADRRLRELIERLNAESDCEIEVA